MAKQDNVADKIAEKKVDRVTYLREQFHHDFIKAIKKSKLISVNDAEFNRFLNKINHSDLYENQPKTSTSKKQSSSEESIDNYVDPAFFSFKKSMNADAAELAKPAEQEIFNFFLENDPTPHKEYLHWYLNLYRHMIKHRKPFVMPSKQIDRSMIQDGTFKDMLFGGDENRFFEDVFKIHEALEKFDFIKRTSSLSDKYKDINQYADYNQLLKIIRPFIPAEEGSNDVDTLDHKELRCIENQLLFEKERTTENEALPRARLMFQDDNWVIVHTVNAPANKIFGKYTTWCTAGTRYGDMFSSYDSNGYLFVLIRKGKGSKREIDKDPSNRIQMHFQSKQYMDALDKSIDISRFLEENPEIKEYFKHYIVKSVLPGMKKQSEHIEFLMKLGYGDQLIKIYKEVMPKSIDLSSFIMKEEHLEELGDIVSLEKLTIQECGLKYIPESFKKLKKLTYLNCSANSELKSIPSWFKDLENLEDIHFTDCDIQGEIDLSGMKKLKQVVLDYNQNLKFFPKGISDLKNLQRLTLSSCDLSVVSDDVLKCRELTMLDVHHNLNLTKVPLDITKMPKICAICLDDTRISAEDIKIMNKHKTGTAQIVLYSER